MKAKRISLGYRSLAFLLSFVMVFSMIPPITVSAVEPGTEDEKSFYGQVSILNADGTINNDGTIQDKDPADVLVIPGETTYQWLEQQDIRPKDGWWAGIRIDVPEAYDAAGIAPEAKFKVGTAEGLIQENLEEDAQGEKYLTLWKSLNSLAESGTIADAVMELDWDNNGVYEQKVTLAVDPLNVTLMKGEETVYEAVELTLKVQGNGTVTMGSYGSYKAGVHTIVLAGNRSLEAQNRALSATGNNDVTEVVAMKLDGQPIEELPKQFDKDATLTVTFATVYEIKVTQNLPDAGTVVAPEKVSGDQKAEIAITANEGYEIYSIVVNGEVSKLEADQKTMWAYQFWPKGEKDYTIHVQFVKVSVVTLTMVGNGDVDFETKEYNKNGNQVTVKSENGNFTLVAKPVTNNLVASILINGQPHVTPYTPVNDETVTHELSADKDYTIVVTFSANVYTVTKNPAENGTVEAAGSVKHGESLAIKVVPGEGYHLVNLTVTVGGEAVTPTDNQDGTYTIEHITGNVVIDATFAINQYTVSLAEDQILTEDITLTVGEASNKPGAPLTVNHGDIVTVTVQDNDSSEVSAITANGSALVVSKNGDIFTATFTATGDTEVSVTYQENAAVTLEQLKFETVLRDYGQETRVLIFGDGETDKVSVVNDAQSIRLVRAYTYDWGWYYGQIPLLGGTDTKELKISEILDEVLKDKESTDNCTLSKDAGYVLQISNGKEWETVDAVLTLAYDTVFPKFTVENSYEYEGEFFYEDVTLSVRAEDTGDYWSGINSFSYAFSTEPVAPTASDAWTTIELKEQDRNAQSTGDYDVTVPATFNNANGEPNVYVWLKAADQAEQVSTEQCILLHFNTVAPGITVAEYDEYSNNDNGETVVLTVTDRYDTFVPENLKILGANGNPIPESDIKITWRAYQNGTTEFVADVTFAKEKTYEWYATYENKTGLQARYPQEGYLNLIVDTIAPIGKIHLEEVKSWTTLLKDLVFGIFKKSKAEDETEITYSITSTWEDERSGINEDVAYAYYKGDATKNVLTAADLEEQYQNGAFVTELELRGDTKCIVYARAEDKSGNVGYISTQGIILESDAPSITLERTETVVGTDYSSNKFTEDVEIQVDVVDKNDSASDIYSGLKSVTYIIEGSGLDKDGNPISHTESGEIVMNYRDVPPEELALSADELEQISHARGPITVKKDDFNDMTVKVTVTATDLAGNTSVKIMEDFSISTTKPSVKVTLDGEPATLLDESDPYGYFGAGRKATITFNCVGLGFERDKALESIHIVKDGVELTAKDLVNLEYGDNGDGWLEKNFDHTVELNLTENGDYTLKVDYTNAFNLSASEKTDYDGKAPWNFVIDQDKPTGEIQLSGESIWHKILDWIAFNIFGREDNPIIATVNAEDAISPVRIWYYKDTVRTDSTAISEEDLNELFAEEDPNEQQFDSFTENTHHLQTIKDAQMTFENEKHFVLYIKVEDYAGNYTYLCSNGAVVDKHAPTITLEPNQEQATHGENTYGYYHIGDTPEITIAVTDIFAEGSDVYSGLQSVSYWIEKDDKNTYIDQETGALVIIEEGDPVKTPLYNFEVDDKTSFDDLMATAEYTILVDPALYNSCNVTVHVEAIDNAGNPAEAEVNLDIDVTAPKIAVSYAENEPVNGNYFNTQQTATVIITERGSHFEKEKVQFHFTARDVNGTMLGHTTEDGFISLDAEGYALDENGVRIQNAEGKELQIVSIQWTGFVPGAESTDQDKHYCEVKFLADANYTFGVSYTDMAGNENDPIDWGTTPEAFRTAFTVDTVIPFGTLTAVGAYKDDYEGTVMENTWDALLSSEFYFGFWANKSITVTETHADHTAGIDRVEYYKSNANNLLNPEGITGWQSFIEPITVFPNEQFTIYMKLTDMAGNISYVSTNGLIVDEVPPEGNGGNEMLKPIITVEVGEPAHGIYNSDVNVKVHVVEPEVGGTYSGLKNISYQVFNEDVSKENSTHSEVLYDFTQQNTTVLRKEFEKEIKIDSVANNSNNVKVVITAVDNAGNEATYSLPLKIDITKPEIHVTYDNNSPDSGTFYKDSREATITITERNFNPDDVLITITNSDGIIPVVSGWSLHTAEGNGDGTTHTAKILYSADGDYEFDVKFTDLAENGADGWESSSTNPAAFTIDQTDPVIRVSYDNNAVANGKYFKANRTATISIVEHNFDVDRVKFSRTVARGGAMPNISWSHSGDRHTATIRYTADGDYTFDVTMTDKAGNSSGAAQYGNTAAGKDFVIDTVFQDMIRYEGVVNGTAYGYDATLVPSMTISDINLANYKVTLVGIQKDKTIDLTEQVNALVQAGTETVTGIFDIFRQTQDLDGIYTLTLMGQDKAGNQDSETVVFTVNRFGSVYVYGESLQELITNGGSYVTSVQQDLVITEYNADKLLADSLKVEITLDGHPLSAVKYEVTPEINASAVPGSSGWYQYKYTLSKDNFASDGVYKIAVSSRDATGNTPKNDHYEGMEMMFRVDSTKAEISSIVGLEKDIINATGVDVKFTIFDAIGLKKILVYVDGEVRLEVVDFDEDRNSYNGSVWLDEKDNAQNVRFVVEDMSGNITDTAAEDFESVYAFHEDVTISTNFLVRWYANTTLFWGSIVAMMAVMATGIWFVMGKRKKKEAQETATE